MAFYKLRRYRSHLFRSVEDSSLYSSAALQIRQELLLMHLRQFKTLQCPAVHLTPLPGTCAPAKEAVKWNTPGRIFKPLCTETSSICKYFKAKTEYSVTTYATNPQWITKLNTKFFLPIYFLLLLLLDSRFSWKERDICLKKFTLGRKEVEHMAFPAMSQGSVKNHTGEKRSVSAVLQEAEHAFTAWTKVKLRMWCGTVFAWTDNFWLVKVWMLWMDFICRLDVPHGDLQLIWYCDTITQCTAPQAHNI